MNENKYKVTIGIPVYNVEKYIRETLTRALEQDMDGIEIIIVDDCGSDNSLNIILELQGNHPNGNNIHIIRHTNNLGAAEGRNNIIKNAQGKYIYFLDSDDLINKSTISTLYAAAEENNAEVTYGSMVACYGDKEEPFSILPSKVLEGENALPNFIYSDIRNNITASSCNILFLAEFLRKNNILFPVDYKIAEDAIFNEILQPLVTKAVLLPDITYYYIKHPNSLMKYEARDVIDIKEARASLRFSEHKKDICRAATHKSYYAGICAKTMKLTLYDVCGIIRHRQILSSSISDKELRNAMRHPANIWQIIHFKQHRNINLIFWLLGVLPPKLSVAAIRYIGIKKGYIRL